MLAIQTRKLKEDKDERLSQEASNNGRKKDQKLKLVLDGS